MKENSIEEITFVENKIKNTRRAFEEVGCHVFFDEDLCKAIEHILSDYKRVLKENESLQKTYDDCYCKYKHYKQFESISVQKIKDKIEELKERKMDIVTSPIHNADEKIEILKKDKIRIQVLQELLESEE